MTDIVVFSRRDLHEFEGAGDRRYTLAPMTYRERQAFQADMVREGCDLPSQERLFAALRAALREIAPENLPALLAVVDEYEAIAADAKPGDKLPEALQAQVDVIEAAARGVPNYAALLAARQQWLGMAPMIALRHALRGWSGEGLPPLRRAQGRVPDDLLDLMGEADIATIGWKAINLGRPSASAEKNSAAPSPSPAMGAPMPAG